MKKLLINLINYLYKKYGTPDVIGMTRFQLELFKNPIAFDEMAKSQKDKYCKEAQNLMANNVLNNILDEVVEGIKKNMLLVTDDKNIIYDRFSINGLFIFKERLQSYAAQAEQQEEEFDQYEAL